MSTRMERYSKPETKVEKRTRRNEQLYETISLEQKELESFQPKSNIEVLGENTNNISIEKIQQILNQRYNEAPKRKSIQIEEFDIKVPEKEDNFETSEHDINSILKKAREKQTVNYDTDRLKKLRDTQYNILEKLELKIEEKEQKKEIPKEDIMTLVNTINAQEKCGLDPLDILAELKGQENTQVVPAIKPEDLEIDTKKVQTKQVIKPLPDLKEKDKKEIDSSFYTASNAFTQSDFDDFNDLKTDVKSNKILIRVLIGLIVMVLLFGVFVLLNGIFNWF